MRHFIRHLLLARAPLAWRPLAAALTLSGVSLLAGCSSLTPVEKLVIEQDAAPLLAQIRAGQVDIDELLPWGGAFGAAPSYFTPLCAAAFGGAVSALDELLAMGADADVKCSHSLTPMDLVMRHSSSQKAVVMAKLLRARRAEARPLPEPVIQARM